jgi:hypothetical protein
MRRTAFLVSLFTALMVLGGCGYIGPVVPPSLHIPVGVTNLAVTEIGDIIQCEWTMPQGTTDNSPIYKFDAVDLRAGEEPVPFDLGFWSRRAKQVPVSMDEVNTQNGESRPVKATIPVSDWEGKNIALALRSAQRHENFSQWSNVVHLRVVPPLETPVVEAASDADGVKITLHPQQPETKFRIFRQSAGSAQPVEAGITEQTVFIDKDAQYGTAYRYTAVAFNDQAKANALSKTSEAQEITPIDTFQPAAPAGVTALASPRSVEVSWDRNTERDVKGYFVYRSVDGAPFARIGNLLNIPAYSDKDVQAGKKYSYQISAVDLRNNESDRSAPVTVTF